MQSIFVKRYDPPIEEQAQIDGQSYMLVILDTAGTEQFTAMQNLNMKKGHGSLLIYSITGMTSFHRLHDFSDQIAHVKGIK